MLHLKLRLISLFCACAFAAIAGERPNVVLILSDDQAWTDYGFMGHATIRTPHLDQLAKQSAVFRRGYVPTALCRPALATIATGLYSQNSGITGNDPKRTDANRLHADAAGKSARELLISKIDECATVPALLIERGYLTFQSGKWWEGSFGRGGFTHGMTQGYPHAGGRHGDRGLKIGREGLKPIFDFIKQAGAEQKPFFVWYAPFLPHTPHNPPERLLRKYAGEIQSERVAKYYAMCEWFDETCGQLLDHLEEQRLTDNTLIIYATDNGWIQRPDHWSYAARSKRSPYDGGTRTPIMFRWPQRFKPDDRSDLCSSIDIAPTILAAAGIEPPKSMPGINLIPSLATRTPLPRTAIFGSSFDHDVVDLGQPEATLNARWVIRGRHKLLLRRNSPQVKWPATTPELYDLIADPFERLDLSGGNPEIVRELSLLIESWYPIE